MTEKNTPPSARQSPRPPRQSMPEQPPEVRVTNFNEVPLGYTEEQARTEASRCLQCKKPLCVTGCPVEVDIPRFIRLVTEGKFIEASRVIKETNSLPAVCGRVCPQESQCEAKCVLGKKDQPVAIGRLERFVADYEREHSTPERTDPAPVPAPAASGRRVAVVGSGPASLTCAADLAKMGHRVTVFEALHVPGGVLVYGIPEFRLPKAIVQAEVDYIRSLGVEVVLDCIVGRTLSVEELFAEGYEAVFVGSGAGLPILGGVPGENLAGIYSANEYLTRVNLMKAYLYPQYDTPVIRGGRVVVWGGGNVAMDSARTARRLDAEKVTVVYRRSRTEMPARVEEVAHAEEEGVEIMFLANIKRFLGDEKGRVREVECIRMELGEPDSSGRRRPIEVPGTEFTLPADVVVVALGNRPHPLIAQTTPGLKTGRKGELVVDEDLQTSLPGVFAGGDIVTGSATVIEAIGAGRRAARSIHRYLTSGTDRP